MASYEVLKEIVRNGSNLVLSAGTDYDVLTEIAAIASQTGAKITVPTSMNYDIVRELSATYGNTITFVDGLEGFAKP